MSHEAKIHQAQTDILRELLFQPQASFSHLQKITGLESDHFKFHIKRLADLGYIDKVDSNYRLTIKGKEYSNKLDTDKNEIERQPKVAVMLAIRRPEKNGDEFVVQERRKHPYFGFWGLPTGKIRWGEAIVETASRESVEETGLDGTFTHRGIFHERVVHTDTGETVEDKIFHLMLCDNATGKLQEEFEGGRNAWRTLASMQNETKRYNTFDLEAEIAIKSIPFTEMVQHYGDDQF